MLQFVYFFREEEVSEVNWKRNGAGLVVCICLLIISQCLLKWARTERKWGDSGLTRKLELKLPAPSLVLATWDLVLALGLGMERPGAGKEKANIFLFSLPLLLEENMNCWEHRLLRFTVTKQGSCSMSWGEMCFLGEGRPEGASMWVGVGSESRQLNSFNLDP